MYRFIPLAVCVLLCCGCTDSPTTTGSNQQVIIGGDATNATFNVDGHPTVVFQVPGMHCDVMCTPKVRKTLAQQVGVVDVKTDLDNKTATVAVKPDIFDPDAAVTALREAEFPETSLQEPQAASPQEQA